GDDRPRPRRRGGVDGVADHGQGDEEKEGLAAAEVIAEEAAGVLVDAVEEVLEAAVEADRADRRAEGSQVLREELAPEVLAAGDERGHAGGLLAPEGLFLQIDVVDDLADGADGLVGDAEAVAEDFEGAALGVVGEVAAVHVEGDAIAGKPKSRLLVNETPDQP